MKKLIILPLLMLGLLSADAQITLDHIYPNAGSQFNGGPLLRTPMHMINLEVSGLKYIYWDRVLREIQFYNLDHSLFKTVDYSAAPVTNNTVNVAILYISETLFDLDPDIDFMYYCCGEFYIYNEDMTVLFNSSNMLPYFGNEGAVFNTPDGTKMILNRTNGEARIFSLPGTLASTAYPACPDDCPDCIFSQQGTLRFSGKEESNQSKGE